MSVAKRDYYEVLSVSRDCDEQTLKSSYRKLALQYHPDRNPGNREAEEKFKEAAEAYAIALRLYELKGNITSAARARSFLESCSAGTSPSLAPSP